MKRLRIMALLVAVVMLVGAAGVFAVEVPDSASVMTSRFYASDIFEVTDAQVSMINEDRDLVIHIFDETPVVFEHAIPVSDDSDELSADVRDALVPGQTLADLLEGRMLTVTYAIVLMSYPGQTNPLQVVVHFEEAVYLPGFVGDGENGYIGIVPPIYELPDHPAFWDVAPPLNGEIVVNGVMIDAPAPVSWGVDNATTVMVPLRAVAEALGYEVNWDENVRGIRLGVAINLWIGEQEVHVGRMAPLGFMVPPTIIDNVTFVPINFFRVVLNQYAYVFEGQVVIETETDMH